MFGRRKMYKKGLADAMYAYESFGQKQEAAIAHMREEVRKGNLELKTALSNAMESLGSDIEGIYDYLDSKEINALYSLCTPFDIKELPDPEKRVLLSILYQMANDSLEEINENQRKFIRSIQKYLDITNPQTSIDYSVISNIDSLETQRIFLQVVLEYIYLQDGTEMSIAEEDVLDNFSVNRKQAAAIEMNVSRLYNAVGSEGIAEKYGFVSESSQNRENKDEGRVVKQVGNLFESYFSNIPSIVLDLNTSSIFKYACTKSEEDYKKNIAQYVKKGIDRIIGQNGDLYREITKKEYDRVASALLTDFVKIFNVPSELWDEITSAVNVEYRGFEEKVKKISLDAFYDFEIGSNTYEKGINLDLTNTSIFGQPRKSVVYVVNEYKKENITSYIIQCKKELDYAIWVEYKNILEQIKRVMVSFVHEHKLHLSECIEDVDLASINDGKELFDKALLMYSANRSREQRQMAVAAIFKACGTYNNMKAKEHIVEKYLKGSRYEFLGCTEESAILIEKIDSYSDSGWYNGKYLFYKLDANEDLICLGKCSANERVYNLVSISNGNVVAILIHEEVLKCYVYYANEGKIYQLDEIDEHVAYPELFIRFEGNGITYGARNGLTGAIVEKNSAL